MIVVERHVIWDKAAVCSPRLGLNRFPTLPHTLDLHNLSILYLQKPQQLLRHTCPVHYITYLRLSHTNS